MKVVMLYLQNNFVTPSIFSTVLRFKHACQAIQWDFMLREHG